MYERYTQPLLPRRKYLKRLGRSTAAGGAMIAASLAIGILGYHALNHLGWVDSFLEASMIMAGMGPIAQMHSSTAKIFSGIYALYCGLTLLSTTALILSPIVHRFLHKFHLADEAKADD